jgi:hypothetical protein
MNRLRQMDWHAVAGIIAAVVALVLHLLHIVDEDIMLATVLVILAIMMIRDLHREGREEDTGHAIDRVETAMMRIEASLHPPDAVLVGPRHLREESERFAKHARGEMIWFNVCLLMFVPQSLFDVLLRPAVENPQVRSIRFILDSSAQDLWATAVMPKVRECLGAEKVQEPIWRDLHESISFILADVDEAGTTEAHVSFWGEPFMSRQPGRDIPRYIFHVLGHSELIGRLTELQRAYTLQPAGDGGRLREPKEAERQ